MNDLGPYELREIAMRAAWGAAFAEKFTEIMHLNDATEDLIAYAREASARWADFVSEEARTALEARIP